MSTTLESPAQVSESPAQVSPCDLEAPPREHQFRSQVVPRHQWDVNAGYCGETSFICAGLYFGQYCSQYTARALAAQSPYTVSTLAAQGLNDGTQAGEQWESASQLLLGDNGRWTAGQMMLKYSEPSSETQADTPQFIAWVKGGLLAGYVPIIGVLNNVYTLGEWPQNPGDGTYDHIVPVVGWASDEPLDEENAGRYCSTDVITFSDNGLYGPCGPADDPYWKFFYSYEVASFQTTPSVVYSETGPLYGLLTVPKDQAVPNDQKILNYGIAIEGVVDLNNECVPVRLSNDTDFEEKRFELKSEVIEKQREDPGYPTPEVLVPGGDGNIDVFPIQIQLTATVSVPDDGADYILYRYDDFGNVPSSDFNAHADKAAQSWTIKAGEHPGEKVYIPGRPDPVWQVPVSYAAMSDETVVFRAVKAPPKPA